MNLPLGGFDDEQVLGPEARESVPWENLEVSVLVGLVDTIKAVLGQPGKFFSHMVRQGGWGLPLGFALILGTAGMLASFHWQMVQLLLIGGSDFWLPFGDIESFHLGPGLVIGIALLIPLVVLVTQFLGSLFLQWAVLIVGGWKPTYEAAFRVTAYTHAALVACFLPLLGGVIAGLWSLILEFKALVRVFRLSRVRALVALLLASCFSLTLFVFLPLILGMALWM